VQNKISLIIPALSSSFYVEDFLINVLLWKKLPDEIIVVNTSKKIFVDKFLVQKLKKKKVELVIIKKSKLYPGAARNIGILKSKYKYVLFLDINTSPFDKNWLKINFDYLLKKKLDGICGRTIYLADTFVEKIIRASTYGRTPLKTIPGSIFNKKTILSVGKFDENSRAGEDTDWLQRLNKLNFKIRESKGEIFYKGLFKTNFNAIIVKWFRNYYKSASLPHLNIQKNLYLFSLFLIMFIIVFNWNYSTLCFTSTICLNNYNAQDGYFIPHITKIFLLATFTIYSLTRGIYFPLKKKIKLNFLFPLNFIPITIFSFILDSVKLITFLYLFFLRILK
jgi:hypothetical protein